MSMDQATSSLGELPAAAVLPDHDVEPTEARIEGPSGRHRDAVNGRPCLLEVGFVCYKC